MMKIVDSRDLDETFISLCGLTPNSMTLHKLEAKRGACGSQSKTFFQRMEISCQKERLLEGHQIRLLLTDLIGTP